MLIQFFIGAVDYFRFSSKVLTLTLLSLFLQMLLKYTDYVKIEDYNTDVKKHLRPTIAREKSHLLVTFGIY